MCDYCRDGAIQDASYSSQDYQLIDELNAMLNILANSEKLKTIGLTQEIEARFKSSLVKKWQPRSFQLVVSDPERGSALMKALREGLSLSGGLGRGKVSSEQLKQHWLTNVRQCEQLYLPVNFYSLFECMEWNPVVLYKRLIPAARLQKSKDNPFKRSNVKTVF